MNASSSSLLMTLSGALLMTSLVAQDAAQSQLPAQSAPQPTALLSQEWNARTIRLEVALPTDPTGKLMGMVVVSFRSELCSYFTGLPTMLCDSTVLAAGYTDDVFVTKLDRRRLPEGAAVYAQGLISDRGEIHTSAVIRIGPAERDSDIPDSDG
ncbi:MAG: hypothetical protein KDC98_25045 [Planctomycetes bacterium]|nr:hypothetical protein [Planctomycetota bacterium]